MRIIFLSVNHYGSLNFQHDEKRKSVIVKEVNQLHTAILRVTNRIIELENERKTIQIQMQSEQKKIGMLADLLAKEQKLLQDKKETLYQVEFDVQKCEMKLERIRGQERDRSEIERKQKKIEELQVSLTEKTATSKLLQNQIASLEVSLSYFFSKFLLQDLIKVN